MSRYYRLLLDGPLNSVLRVNRVFGLAPVTFNYTGIVISKPLVCYSFLFITFCNTLVMTGFIRDIRLTGEPTAYRTNTKIKMIIWVPDVVLNMIISNYGVFESPWRMSNMVIQAQQFKKITADLNYKGFDKYSKNGRNMFLSSVTFISFLVIMDTITNFIAGIPINKDQTIMYGYIGFYIQYVMFVLLNFQFLIMVISVNNLLKALNSQLEEMLTNFLLTVDHKNTIRNLTASIEKIKLSRIYTIDYGSRDNDANKFYIINMKTAPGTIQRLALAYNEISLMIKQIDDAYGPQSVLLVLLIILHLVVTPFYLLLAIISSSSMVMPAVGMTLWGIFHLTNMCMSIEPPHQTYVLTRRTRALVSSLALRVPRSEPLAAELRSFSQQLLLHTNTFTVMGMATLSRPLIASIMVSVTTYLIIIIQFQIYEPQGYTS